MLRGFFVVVIYFLAAFDRATQLISSSLVCARPSTATRNRPSGSGSLFFYRFGETKALIIDEFHMDMVAWWIMQ